MPRPVAFHGWRKAAWAAVALAAAGAASAQTEGGLYIAGAGASFQAAAQRALAQNRGGQRFFVLALPPETSALTTRASAAQAALRDRVQQSNGVLFVCQRDVDSGRVPAARLAPGVVTVRGWPPAQAGELSDGRRAFAGENPATLPASNEALRRLRSSCS
jgi:hypothetical protein